MVRLSGVDTPLHRPSSTTPPADKGADTRGGEIVGGPIFITIRKSDQLHGGRTGRCIDNDADRVE